MLYSLIINTQSDVLDVDQAVILTPSVAYISVANAHAQQLQQQLKPILQRYQPSTTGSDSTPSLPPLFGAGGVSGANATMGLMGSQQERYLCYQERYLCYYNTSILLQYCTK